MKKIILLVLCFIFILSGCEKLEKAEPYYTETRDDVTCSAQYKYYFTDESSVRCTWVNTTTESFSFYDTFELHVLDGEEWYVVSKGDEVSFNTDYCHRIEPENECTARYYLSLYADELKEGKTYRISTYFYDNNGNNYQAFVEFICDNKLAEEEMAEVIDNSMENHSKTSYNGDYTIIQDNG